MATHNLTSADDVTRRRVSQVFHFVRALQQQRSPAVLQLADQPWSMSLAQLPDHPCVRVRSRGDDEADWLVRVRRPEITECPSPPVALEGWLRSGWKDPVQPIKTIESIHEQNEDGEIVELRFEEDHDRVMDLEGWSAARETWARREIPARQAMGVFHRLYELRGSLSREGEAVQLILGDGILKVDSGPRPVNHPVLVQPAELDFDPKTPEFFIRETSAPPELYSEALQVFDELDSKAIHLLEQELTAGNLDILGCAANEGFLRRLVNTLDARGSFVDGAPAGRADFARVGSAPVLALRSRNRGFVRALDQIIRDVHEGATIPASLKRIVGVDADYAGQEDEPAGATWQEPPDILLSKEANPEQIQIAERLDRHGSVLVQGPPGTGKTHTIANLIGHLLAKGKRILVTSHASKALRVLREQVVDPLRPLCVSVLDNDAESRKQLEASVEAIQEKLSNGDADHFERRAHTLDIERTKSLETLNKTRQQLLEARTDEYRDVVVAGQGYFPARAARRVRAGKRKDDWIPPGVRLGVPLPLSHAELTELYKTNEQITPEDQRELDSWVPDLRALPTADNFEETTREVEALVRSDRTTGREYWKDTPQRHDEPGIGASQLKKLLVQFREAADKVNSTESWQMAIILAGQRGAPVKDVWTHLCEQIESLERQADAAQDTLLSKDPVLACDSPVEKQLETVNQILEHFAAGGRIGWLTLIRRKSWRPMIHSWIVNEKAAEGPKDFEAIRVAAELELARRALRRRWGRQVTAHQGPAIPEDIQAPERICAQYTDKIKRLLSWSANMSTLIDELRVNGFEWRAFLDDQEPVESEYGELLRLLNAVRDRLPGVLEVKIRTLRLGELRQRRKGWLSQFRRPESVPLEATAATNLHGALNSWNSEGYAEAYALLARLDGLKPILHKRRELLGKLQTSAAAWATAIAERRSVHGAGELPGDAAGAWLWRQLTDELDRRSTVSMGELQGKIEEATEKLRVCTTDLIQNRAWAGQLRRTDLRQRQALSGWKNLVRRIGKGTGKRAARLKAEARDALQRSREAVPVWVMPMARVVESFTPSAGLFDVVIIDEASQSDMLGLIALYLGKSVVVVGDHEQVSPSAVGEKVADVESLIGQHLEGLPNAALYDGRRSIYDMAQEAFGGVICLREHFRSVPEIIEFSNQLCYEGRIRPLRASNGKTVKPHVVAHRVSSGQYDRRTKCNPEEAEQVVALIQAATERSEYADQSIGVISMVGHNQAILIESMLRDRLSPEVFERHRILCGNAAHFQGDERDVMFLSMVESSDGGPSPLRTADLYRQRFNVATSRAKEQMWVVHSLNPDIDLKDGDLRKRLIRHAENPQALLDALKRGKERTESEFEERVRKHLVRRGYKVTPQWPVGYYRIDLVVEGGGEQLAVECDGDRHHPIEKLADDMARQALLERLGWRFVRIRGSVFFRDEEAAMEPLLTELERRNIVPEGLNQESACNELSQQSPLAEGLVLRAEEIRNAASTSEEPAEESSVDTTNPVVHVEFDRRQARPIQSGVPLELSENRSAAVQHRTTSSNLGG